MFFFRNGLEIWEPLGEVSTGCRRDSVDVGGFLVVDSGVGRLVGRPEVGIYAVDGPELI